MALQGVELMQQWTGGLNSMVVARSVIASSSAKQTALLPDDCVRFGRYCLFLVGIVII